MVERKTLTVVPRKETQPPQILPSVRSHLTEQVRFQKCNKYISRPSAKLSDVKNWTSTNVTWQNKETHSFNLPMVLQKPTLPAFVLATGLTVTCIWLPDIYTICLRLSPWLHVCIPVCACVCGWVRALREVSIMSFHVWRGSSEVCRRNFNHELVKKK